VGSSRRLRELGPRMGIQTMRLLHGWREHAVQLCKYSSRQAAGSPRAALCCTETRQNNSVPPAAGPTCSMRASTRAKDASPKTAVMTANSWLGQPACSSGRSCLQQGHSMRSEVHSG
jgi:hypothetical protein